MILWRLGALTTIVAVLASCSSTSDGSDPASLEASAGARILAIPAPSPEKYRGMIGAKGWQNPYLIIKPAGVALLDPDNHEEILFKPEELTQALGKLPASAWPYGRVVAIEESPLADKKARPAIRRQIEAAIQQLNDLGVIVDEWPAR